MRDGSAIFLLSFATAIDRRTCCHTERPSLLITRGRDAQRRAVRLLQLRLVKTKFACYKFACYKKMKSTLRKRGNKISGCSRSVSYRIFAHAVKLWPHSPNT